MRAHADAAGNRRADRDGARPDLQGERARHPQLAGGRHRARACILRNSRAGARPARARRRGAGRIRHRARRDAGAASRRRRHPRGRPRGLCAGRLADDREAAQAGRRRRARRQGHARSRRDAARRRAVAAVSAPMSADPVLVTGAAGFIGFHVARRLLADGRPVVGLDNLNAYYDPALKQARLDELAKNPVFHFVKLDLADRAGMAALFAQHGFQYVVHLAAQAGVRYSLVDPHAYAEANLIGFLNVLEGCRHAKSRHLVYASSSSVYGANTQMPFSTAQNVDHPLSLYGATKKANELMAHAYAHLFGLPTTGLRFFTVYGPWGRPDMAMWLFTDAILAGRPIDVFNHGRMRRDFTYVDDIVEGVVRVADRVPVPNPEWSAMAPDPASSFAPYRIYNIGNNRPVELMSLIGILEQALGRKAVLNFLPMQPGDVPATYADIDDLSRDVGFRPSTSIETGVEQFVRWYRGYHGV